ncbi:MAG TPA: cytochrome c peroxidase [Bradyrhizobium sp.]|nr:cytochrome c peroxidase [Bradyrhizobium sp.]
MTRTAAVASCLWWLALSTGPCAALASAAAVLSAPAPAQPSVLEDEPITPIPQPPAADPLKLALGERLFGDIRLSADGKLACASCHDIRTNGAGGKAAAVGSKPSLDTLTVFNAALSFRLGWQGKFRSLAEHVEASLENPANMNTNAEAAVRRLQKDPEMTSQFRAAYGRAPDRDGFLDALSTFERSLLTPGARFDRWLGGDTSALSSAELEGYRTFKSLGCSACHQGVNVGGNLFERQGVFRPLVSGPPRVVRVPSLRNVATTAPYFHDGSAATLEDAVRRMAAAQLDRTLSDQQVASLVLFLKTLTGRYRGSPAVGAVP